MNNFDTWLTEVDIERLWAVCHGTLPEIYASADEIDEFHRLVTHAAMLRVAGPDYTQATVQ
jgi:hypothetical protein